MMNDAAELMQRTDTITWNRTEWLLPVPQNEIQKEFGYISILIARNDSVLPGKYSTKQIRFFDWDGEPIDAQDVDFWVYMPKHPTK